MSTFKFKQFEVDQDRCAQKIGTDGVLLAAWATPDEQPGSVLDIGAGTGVISLIAAQRFYHAQIDAVELDQDAYEQCTDNFENSIWADRLFCYHSEFQEFYEEIDERYDLIISNPPFFSGDSISDKSSITQAREQARFDTTLPFEDLVYGVYKLLHSNGLFACIIPADRLEELIAICAHFTLLPEHITHVKGSEDSTVKRCLCAFRFRESELTTNTLIIEKSRHNYTDDYIKLVEDFYLKM